MTRIDFYILPTAEPEDRWLFACRLIEKAYNMGHQLYIHTQDEQATASMDDALWRFRNDSFIPHNPIDPAMETPAAVEIGHDRDPQQHHDILINLAHQTPKFFSRFHRVAEVVIQQPEILAATRKNFSFYRDRGYPMHTHDMRSK